MNLFCVGLLALSATLVFARGTDTPPDLAQALQVKELIARAANSDNGAIFELGRRREKSAMALLRKISKGSEATTAARVALAKMGDAESLNYFIVGLSSSNGQVKAESIYILGEIGDRKAVKHLAPFLLEGCFPTPHRGVPFPMAASMALQKILPDVAVGLKQQYPGYKRSRSEQWRGWWNEHRGEFTDAAR